MNQWKITQGDINFGEYGGYATRQCDENSNEFAVMEVVPASERPMAMVRYATIDTSEEFEISSEESEKNENFIASCSWFSRLFHQLCGDHHHHCSDSFEEKA